MTLARQTIIIAVFALILIFISTFIIGVQNTRTYFTKQLEINATDTSTSLGLTISSKIQSVEDKTLILSIINAAFDRGHFKNITMRDNDGGLIASRYLENMKVKVPSWFVKLVSIKTNPESAVVMRGWHQLGKVEVESDSSIAYLALWRTTKDLFMFFLVATLVIILLTIWLMKVTFRPLNVITKQAADIGKKNLYIVPQVSRLLELKLLTETMNNMVVKLKEYFAAQIREVEKLRVEVYQDPLTGNGNRHYFFGIFNQYLSDEKTFLPGYLFLLKISGLIEFNKENGYQAGDQILRDISAVLDKAIASKHRLVLARLDNPSFAIILLEQSNQQIQDIGAKVATEVNNLLANKSAKALKIGIGVSKCNFGDTASSLLSLTDGLISKQKSNSQCEFSLHEDDEAADVSAEWRDKIMNAIQEKKFNFYTQPIRSADTEHHKECFIKLLNADGSEISAGYFFPIVDEYGLGGQVDRLVVQEILQYLPKGLASINLSRKTLLDENEQTLFLQTLQDINIPKGLKLCFELTEAVLDENITLVKGFILKLQELGFSVGLDRVGIILAPLGYLSEVNLSYLKLDPSFTKNIEKHKEHCDLINKWVELVATLDLALIATAVETEVQWSCLRNLGVNYFQGNYVQSPHVVD